MKILCHSGEICLDRLFRASFFCAELSGKFVRPFFDRFRGVSGGYFVRFRLIFQKQQHIAVDKRRKSVEKHFRRDFEAAVFFKPRKAHGDDGNEPQPHFFKGFSQKKYVIRGSATAARLKEEKCGFFGVVISRFQSVQKLPARAYRGVTHIVVQIFKPRVDNVLSLVTNDLEIVAVHTENTLEKLHMRGKNIGAENGIFSFHLLCKINHLTHS